MPDYTQPSADPNVLSEPTTNRDGTTLGATAYTQVVLLGRNPSDGRVDTFDPLQTVPTDQGVYGYAAGTATGTVDVPSTARLKRVAVLAGASAASTITIGGGNTITVPAGSSFDELVPGLAVGADVVIGGGAPQSFYVSWVV